MLDPVSLSLMGGNRVGEAIRRMTEGPRFADVGSIERGMAQVMELYLEVQTAARSYEGVVARAWVEVNQRFIGEVSKRFGSDRQLLQAKDALKIWLDIANETLMKTHRSTAFLEAQRQLLRAGMDFLLAERKLVEQLVEPAGLPTRSEMDELHNTVQTLKRRVRALERARAAEGRSSSRQVAARPRSRTPKRSAKGVKDEHNAFQGRSGLVARSQWTSMPRYASGIEKLSTIKDEQIQIATTPKDEIFRTDKVTLYRYRPLTETRFRTPMLIIYGLIGRHTMTDLQEDRSLGPQPAQPGCGSLGGGLGQRQ